jgi:uncharacterized protein
MPSDKGLPYIVPTSSTVPQVRSNGLVARGLLAIQLSLAIVPKNDAESLFQMGMGFKDGESGTPPDYDKARTCLQMAAELDHAEAQLELCLLLLFLDADNEEENADGWLKKSVAQGFGPAQKYLAEALYNCSDTDGSSASKRNEAFRLYGQASAWYEQRANAGDAKSQYDWARMLRHPETRYYNHKVYSPDKAMLWMKAAAEQDHALACQWLGEWLLDDKDPQHNVDQGIYWLSRAGGLGNAWACFKLGDLYLFGCMGGATNRIGNSQIVASDKRLAILWYERRIELERKYGSFNCQFSLAKKYLIGDHLDQDSGLAERMLLQAANAGDVQSQNLLGAEYASGTRLKRDAATALRWLRAYERNPDSSKRTARYNLGQFYEHEADDAPNYPEAIEWYLRAADEGDYRSLRALGDIYEFGKGVNQDDVQAYKWYLLSIAFSHGKRGIKDFHTGTVSSRDALAEKITVSQRAEAGRLAKDWMDQPRSMREIDLAEGREGLSSAS